MAYAGIDLGATNVRAEVADDHGSVVGSVRTATPQGPSGIAVTEAVLDALRSACADAGVDPTDVQAVGIASIGPLDLAAGVVEHPSNLPDTIDRIPLTGPVSKLVDSDRVHLHNDANAGVIGERFYSDRTPDDMVYLTISSGIGTGVCVDGRILSGWDGNAGEFGHVTLDADRVMQCGCGRGGHWEAYCSGENIPRYAAHLHGEAPVETTLALDDPELDAADVFDAADAGDEFAVSVLERVADWNIQGVAALAHAYAPLVIFVGGAVALHHPEWIVDPISERLAEQVFVNVPDVQLTTLGEDVVIRGALASAMTDGTGDPARFRS
jgi:glucokinase